MTVLQRRLRHLDPHSAASPSGQNEASAETEIFGNRGHGYLTTQVKMADVAAGWVSLALWPVGAFDIANGTKNSRECSLPVRLAVCHA